jgi:hypothetical protein
MCGCDDLAQLQKFYSDLLILKFAPSRPVPGFNTLACVIYAYKVSLFDLGRKLC